MLTWQNNESASAQLFARLIYAGNTDAAVAAFYAVNSFAQKLAMLKSAARSVCARTTDFDEDQLTALLDRLADANRLRNRLSHSEVREIFSDGVYQYFLELPEAAWSGSKAKDRRCDAATVMAAEATFQELAADILAFIDVNLAR